MIMNIPIGKTPAVIVDAENNGFNEGDKGWIDGYIQSPARRPFAVFVRADDGRIGGVTIQDLMGDLTPTT
jgi:hypothetical protein